MGIMRVRMRQALSGAGISLKPGDEHEGDSVELARWCASGIAEPLKKIKARKATSGGAESAEKAVPAPPKTPEVLDTDET